MRIYFSGIGGVGIGPLAEIAHDAGYDVCGSDQSASPLTAALMERGIHVALDQSGTFLQEEHDKQPFDWFVYTAALPADHPELVLAHKLGIKTGKRDELLAHIISDKNLKLVAVAGTHGKTTTTSMIVWTLQQLGIPVSYSVGSTLSFGPSGKFDPTSQFFIYECDEFDRNFLNFKPWLSLITSVDYDHPDTYPTEADYLAAFHTFGHQSDSIIAWQETAACFDDHNVQVLTEYNPDIHLAGEHNRCNGMLTLEAVKRITETDEATIITSINQFPGAGRRFEKLAEGLYSDYGHHPVEIKATLQLAQELSDHVVLVYQPHQNVRQHEIMTQYTADVFEAAEMIYWLPTYLTRENPDLPVLTPQELTRHIVASRPDVVTFAELDDALWDHITASLDAGKLVLCMGAGTIDHWVRQHATALDA